MYAALALCCLGQPHVGLLALSPAEKNTQNIESNKKRQPVTAAFQPRMHPSGGSGVASALNATPIQMALPIRHAAQARRLNKPGMRSQDGIRAGPQQAQGFMLALSPGVLGEVSVLHLKWDAQALHRFSCPARLSLRPIRPKHVWRWLLPCGFPLCQLVIRHIHRELQLIRIHGDHITCGVRGISAFLQHWSSSEPGAILNQRNCSSDKRLAAEAASPVSLVVQLRNAKFYASSNANADLWLLQCLGAIWCDITLRLLCRAPPEIRGR